MIVDTSALIAILLRQSGADALLDAIVDHRGALPAPARVEYLRVASGARIDLGSEAAMLLDRFERLGLDTVPFTSEHASIAIEANARFGKGTGTGGVLNLLDLMVYAVAKQRGQPLLCTGDDFALTDLPIHPASRRG